MSATKTLKPIVTSEDGSVEFNGYDNLPDVRPAKKEAGTELATLPKNLAEAFSPGGLTIFIEAVEAKAKEFESDISTPTGQRELKSLCRKIASSRNYADEAGKEYNSELKEKTKAVDAERKRMRDALQAVEDEKRKPLTDWEAVDQRRKDDHEAAIAAVMVFGDERRAGTTAAKLGEMIEAVQPFKVREWEEFTVRASKVISNVEHYLKEAHAAAIVAEAEKAELARLRKEAAERKQREHEEQLVKEAAERATRETEERANAEKRIAEAKARREIEEATEKARIEAEWVQDAIRKDKAREEAEHRAVEKARQDAEDRAFAAETAKKAAEKKAKELAAKVEADKKAASFKAERDRQEAVENERKRVERERLDKIAADAKRADDKKHKASVHRLIIDALHDVADLQLADAEAVLRAIDEGRVPGVTIQY